MLKTLSVIIYLISFILIFEEIFRLSYFVYKYNKSYDYGKILQKNCKKEYIERETSRFHIALNENDIFISNTENNKKLYFTLILIISILFTSIISIIFSIIIYNIYCNINFNNLNDYKIQHKIYIFIILLICIITIIYPILLIFYKLKELKYRKNISLFSNSGNINRFIPYILIFIVLIILKTVIIYYNYQVPNFKIITEDNNKNNIYDLIIFTIYTFIYLVVIYYITNFIILYNYYNENIEINETLNNNNDKNILIYYLNKVFGFNEHNKYINKISSVVKIDNTLNEVIVPPKILPKSLKEIGDIPEINKQNILAVTNDLGFDAATINEINIIVNTAIMDYRNNIYTEELIKKTDNIQEKILNFVKYIETKLQEIDSEKKFLGSILAQKIISEIDNLIISINNNNNPEIEKINEKKITYNHETIFRKNLSGLIFILILMVFIFAIIQFFLKKYDLSGLLQKNIKLYILIPFIILLIILLITNSTIEYNTLINKYILINPTELYKKNLNNINGSFNILLEEEYYKYLNKNFIICKNVRNSFILVILSNILYINLLNNNNINENINAISNITIPTEVLKSGIKCNNEPDIYDEFKFDGCIIRDSCRSTNVFFGRNNENEPNDINNCNLVNYVNIKSIIKNLLIFDNIDFTDGVVFINTNGKTSDTLLITDTLFNNTTVRKKFNINSNEWLKLKNKNNIDKNNYYSYHLKLNDKNNNYYYRIADDNIFNQLLSDIYLKTNNNNIKNISDYILYEIIYNNKIYNKFKLRIEYIKTKLKKLFSNSINETNEHTFLINEENFNNLLITDFDNNYDIKQYDNIIDKIINKYIDLLIKNIYLLSILLNSDNEKIELGELYNKMTSTPNTDRENRSDHISLKLKNKIILYINNLVKEISIFFDDINNDFKLKNNNFKNVLNNYIINNYNNINENNIYNKDIILPYLEKTENKNLIDIKIENLIKIIELNIKNYNNLRIYICNNVYNLNNECVINDIKLDKINIIKNLNNNISDIDNFIREFDKIELDTEEDYLKNLEIINGVEGATDDINDLFTFISDEYNGLKQIYKQLKTYLQNKENTDDDIKKQIKTKLYTQQTYDNNNKQINIYLKIIKNSLNNSKINKKNIEEDNIDKNISITLNDNINQVNKSIFILIIVYIISIILINYIR